MRELLISIQPKWCELIASAKKTIEVRKTKPKLKTPFKVYVYCTKDEHLYRSGEMFWCGEELGNGKVIGEFVCDKLVWVVSHPSIFAGHDLLYKQAIEDACLTTDEVEKYSNGKDLYGWHISNLVIYDKPKKLSEFRKAIECHRGKDNENCVGCWDCKITRPPQSWCYVKKEEEAE